MADVKDFRPRLSSSRMFSYVKGESKDFDNGKVDDKFYNFMTSSYEKQEHLTDSGMFAFTAPLIYQLDLLKEDMDDIHSHLSESKFTSKVQKYPVVDVTEQFFVSGLTQLKGNTQIDGFTDIRGDFKVNGETISNLKPSLKFSDSLRTKSLISSSAQMASNISGSFTSLSASIATDINNAGGGTVDTALKDGSTNAVTNNAVVDGLALKLNLTGGTMTGLVQEPYNLTDSATLATAKGVIDARATRFVQINNQKGQTWTLNAATPSDRGQELTIIAMGAGTITHTNPGKLASGIFVSPNGSNISVAANTVVKFVTNYQRNWYQVV